MNSPLTIFIYLRCLGNAKCLNFPLSERISRLFYRTILRVNYFISTLERFISWNDGSEIIGSWDLFDNERKYKNYGFLYLKTGTNNN